MGEIVEFDGISGYVADGDGPGVVVLHEWWGLVPHIKDVCERFAALGFTALAPDLYRGPTAASGEPDDAEKLMTTIDRDRDRATAEVATTVTWLRRRGCAKVGMVGFCTGAALSLAASASCPVDATVAYYGIWPRSGERAFPTEPTPQVRRFNITIRGQDLVDHTQKRAELRFRPSVGEPIARRLSMVRIFSRLPTRSHIPGTPPASKCPPRALGAGSLSTIPCRCAPFSRPSATPGGSSRSLQAVTNTTGDHQVLPFSTGAITSHALSFSTGVYTLGDGPSVIGTHAGIVERPAGATGPLGGRASASTETTREAMTLPPPHFRTKTPWRPRTHRCELNKCLPRNQP